MAVTASERGGHRNVAVDARPVGQAVRRGQHAKAGRGEDADQRQPPRLLAATARVFLPQLPAVADQQEVSYKQATADFKN